LGGSAIHLLYPFRSRGGGVERLSPVGRRPRDLPVAELINEDRAPADPVAIVDRGLDDGKVAAGDDSPEARPPGKGPVHRPAALAAGDALTGLGELNDRVLVKLGVEQLDLALGQRLEYPLHRLPVLRLTHAPILLPQPLIMVAGGTARPETSLLRRANGGEVGEPCRGPVVKGAGTGFGGCHVVRCIRWRRLDDDDTMRETRASRDARQSPPGESWPGGVGQVDHDRAAKH